MFAKDFDKYACVGDAIECEVDGFTIVARIEHDSDAGIDDDDCHPAEYNVEIFGEDTPANRACFEKALAAREAWLRDEWFYCGIVLSVARNGVMLDKHAASLWRVDVNHSASENGNAYLREVANELLPEALKRGRAALEKLNPFSEAQGKVYTRAEIVNGTGFPRDARFIMVNNESKE